MKLNRRQSLTTMLAGMFAAVGPRDTVNPAHPPPMSYPEYDSPKESQTFGGIIDPQGREKYIKELEAQARGEFTEQQQKELDWYNTAETGGADIECIKSISQSYKYIMLRKYQQGRARDSFIKNAKEELKRLAKDKIRAFFG